MKKLLRWLGFHVHEWGQWKPYGYTYQRRACRLCGRLQDKDV